MIKDVDATKSFRGRMDAVVDCLPATVKSSTLIFVNSRACIPC
jgi:hypothetical protein